MTLTDAVRHLGRSDLFRRDAAPQSAGQVIAWWEQRRLAYNLIVGVTGVVTCSILFVVGIICQQLLGTPIGIPDPAIGAVFGAIVYGIMANVYFTGGWVTELLLAHAWDIRPKNFPQVAFGLGLAGSVVLTLVPAVIVLVIAAASIVAHAMGLPVTTDPAM